MPTVRVGQIELFYESMGHGEPLLLVMGLGAQLVLWPDGFCEQLVARGFRVIRFDNRDVGESTRLHGAGVPDFRRELVRWTLGRPLPPPYTIDDMAKDTLGLLDALDLPSTHVVGASMGGMIAQAVAIRAPERVRSLTSIMSHPGDRRSHLAHPRAVHALLRPAPRSREEAMDAHVRFFRVVGSQAFDRDEDGIRTRAALQFDRGTDPRGFARQLVAVLASADRRPHLCRLRVPSLVVHGTIDPLVRPPGGRRTAASIPGARLMEIEGMGHDLPPAVWPRLVEAIEAMRG